MNETMNADQLQKEFSYSAVPSGGPGGQHANKVSTKVILRFDLAASEALSSGEKELLLARLGQKLNAEGQLLLSCDESRSQHRNRETVTGRCIEILQRALTPEKKRIPTSAGKAAKARRMEKKKRQAYKKALRRRPDLD